jgi:hypothetical protein
LTSLPDTIGQLKALGGLILMSCSKLKSMPHSMLELPDDTQVVMCNCPLEATLGLSSEIHYHRMSDIKAAYRRSLIIASLLGDRDARNQSLNYLSIVAVLLATAAFVAFASHPDRAAQLEGRGIKASVDWLRHFFKADQVAFYLSMAVVLFVMVSSMPQSVDADDKVNAGRVWVLYASLSLLLFVAVVCGMFAFVAGAVATYPADLMLSDVLGPGLMAIPLVVMAALQWTLAVQSLFPGRHAIRAYMGASLAGHLSRWVFRVFQKARVYILLFCYKWGLLNSPSQVSATLKLSSGLFSL